jgi:enoyl-CoA hydratase/carnithine racemase
VSHDKLMSRAEEIAASVAKLPPIAVRMMKEFLIRFRDVSVDEAWHASTLMNQLILALTDDAEEGRRAFKEKRQPKYTGALRYPREGDIVT